MKLKEVINEYALTFFGDYAEDVGEVEVKNNMVDMMAVADACEIPVIYMEGDDYSLSNALSGNHSYYFDDKYDIIKINRFGGEDEWRQIIALALSRITVRGFLSETIRLNQLYNELVLNELLAPEKIFKANFELALSATNNGPYGVFGIKEIDNVVEYMADKLHVDPILLFKRVAIDGFGFTKEDFRR